MRFFSRRRALALVTGVLLITSTLLAASADASDSRDVLLHIVTTCLNPAIADYCERCNWPRVGIACSRGTECKNTTEVWAEDDDYVVIRDIKMCGCPDGFVHGLALPRSRVTGVEDPERPNGIWSFAWDAARKRIGDESAIALVVNPKGLRSQDQLHVHIVRLRSDTRQKLDKLTVKRVPCLAEVWNAAAQRARAERLDDYGVLVASHPEGGFMMLVEKKSPERVYTEEVCR